MSRNDLPQQFRPSGLQHKRLNPGIDLPAWFIDEIKSVDPNLYFVYHPYRVIYDDFMNQYEGSMDDPRFTIGEQFGQEIWGYAVTDNKGQPVPEARWHCWRLCEVGWAHIFDVKYLDPDYLRKLVKRLGMQKIITEREGLGAYMKFLREEREAFDAADQAVKQQQYDDFQKENRWLLDKAADNYMSGKIAPTNPVKETITSYAGQESKSRLSRPLTDEEGGLIIPDDN